MRQMMLAGAITLMTMGSATTQARAMDGQDALGVLIGAVAVGALANSISDTRDEGIRDVAEARDWRRDGSRLYGNGHRPRHDRLGRRGRHLPEACLTTYRGHRGLRAALDRRCLRHKGVRVNRLPDRCERQVRTRRGTRKVYALQCLDRHGYRISRRW